MGGVKTVNNPANALYAGGDPRVGVDSDGKQFGYYSEEFEAISSVAVSVGDVCLWVVPTSTAPPKVTNAVATGGSGTFLGAFRFAGVVTDGSPAGGVAKLCKFGWCRVNVGAGTPTIGDMAVLGATAAQADVIAAATGVTAGTFTGNVLGQFWSAMSGGLASLWLNRV